MYQAVFFLSLLQTPMVKAKELIGDKGVIFENMVSFNEFLPTEIIFTYSSNLVALKLNYLVYSPL